MSIIAAPPTLSPGKLALVYTTGGYTHQVSANFIDGVDLNDISTIQIDAEHFADVVAPVLHTNSRILGYKVLSPSGQVLYRGNLGGIITGGHSGNPGMPAYNSTTIKILGRGAPTSVFLGSGNTSLMLFVSNAYALTPDEKYLPTYDAPLAALMADLNSYLRYWADFYGQHADTVGQVACQFNAHEQKRNGT